MKDVEAIRSKRVVLKHQGKEERLLSVQLADWVLEKQSCKTSEFEFNLLISATAFKPHKHV